MGELKSDGGEIPSSAATVRYATLDRRPVGAKGQGAKARTFDSLLDQSSAFVPSSVVPVWVTVRVAKTAAPGLYRGPLVLTAKGIEPITVPIELSVADWTLPDVKDYVCLLNICQSPDTLARHYKTPLWSAVHWGLIERSVALMGDLGNDFIYLPLLSKDQFGNEESMVTWIEQGGAGGAPRTYRYDFALMDKYLDLVLKYHDRQRLKMVVLVAYGSAARKGEATVTALDPATGVKRDLALPRDGTPDCESLWRPLLLAIQQRLKARGLEKQAMIGMPADFDPPAGEVAMFRNILPEAPWMRACHPTCQSLRYDAQDSAKTVPVACNEHVWWPPLPDPAKQRHFGWQLPQMRVSFNRAGYAPLCLLGFCPPWDFRIWLETSLAANDRGAGRVGADFFNEGVKLQGPNSVERGSGSQGTLYNLYPSSQVGQIGLANNTTDLLGAGPTGPVATIRYENAREGLQSAEAVAFVERALLEKRVPEELQSPAWRLIDERINCLRLHAVDLGQAGWQDRLDKLFDLAARIGKSAAH